MKSIVRYIKEEYNDYRVKNLSVPYIVNPENDFIVFKVPEIWSEDDFQIYIQDLYLNELPGGEDHANEFFGKNSENIFDTVFEYEKYEKSEDTDEEDFIEYDNNYDSKVKDDAKFAYVKLEKLRYIIKFDEFDLKDESIEDIDKTLIEIFQQCESSTKNEWPIEIKLDDKNIEYK